MSENPKESLYKTAMNQRRILSASLGELAHQSGVSISGIQRIYSGSEEIRKKSEQEAADEIEAVLLKSSDGSVSWEFNAGEYLFGGKRITFVLEEFSKGIIRLNRSGSFRSSLFLLRNDDEFWNGFCRLMKSVLYVYEVQRDEKRSRKAITATAELASMELAGFLRNRNRFADECELWRIDSGKLMSRCIAGILESEVSDTDMKDMEQDTCSNDCTDRKDCREEQL